MCKLLTCYLSKCCIQCFVFETFANKKQLGEQFFNIPAGPCGPGGPAKKVSAQVTRKQFKDSNQRHLQLLLTGLLCTGMLTARVSLIVFSQPEVGTKLPGSPFGPVGPGVPAPVRKGTVMVK